MAKKKYSVNMNFILPPLFYELNSISGVRTLPLSNMYTCYKFRIKNFKRWQYVMAFSPPILFGSPDWSYRTFWINKNSVAGQYSLEEVLNDERLPPCVQDIILFNFQMFVNQTGLAVSKYVK